MNMHWIDWTIIAGVSCFFIFMAQMTARYMQSTADFLAANRCAGRYVLTMAEGIAGWGAVSIVALMQIYYQVGFAADWWGKIGLPIALFMTLSGWVTYRFRQTRVLTMAQFFEVRYSRRFRCVAGTICWLSGIINFGIFPAIGANFFMNFCGFPSHEVTLLNLFTIDLTHILIMIILLAISLYFTFTGGQITIMITDFFESFFCNIVLLILLIVVLTTFSFSDLFDGLLIADEGKSMVNPFDTGETNFDPFYFVIATIGMFYNRMSWQGRQGYYVSAKSAHEAKMAGVLGNFRAWSVMAGLIILPLVAYVMMHHPNYTEQAALVNAKLSQIADEEVRNQMITPITMTLYLPVGMMGAFAMVMFASFVSTHDTYLHSWGSIFIQDVVLPLRKKPLTPKQHIRWLRRSIFGVAVFIFLWSAFFNQTTEILQLLAITGAIWQGGAGAVIIGGLYTRWGKTSAAYVALFVGSIIATGGIILQNIWHAKYDENFFITGMEFYFIAITTSTSLYLIISLIGRRRQFNLDKMLYRGKYADDKEAEDKPTAASFKGTLKKYCGITSEFTWMDKLIYAVSSGYTLLLFGSFVAMNIVAFCMDLSEKGWAIYHFYRFGFTIIMTFVFTVWLGIGGIRDIIRLFQDLKNVTRDATDDGRVIELTNRSESDGNNTQVTVSEN
jgi:SSS family solute:Na+ symporter